MNIKLMVKNLKSYIMKHRTMVVIAAGVVILVSVFLVLRARQQSLEAGGYQTVTIARGTLTATVGATGTVRANQTAILTWQTTGTVDEVSVRTGELVHAGDVLAVLAQDSLPQNIILAQAELVTAQRNLENLLNSETPKAQAQLALVNAQRAYDNADANYDWLQSHGRAEQADIDNAWAEYVIAQDALDRAQEVFDRVSDRAEDDPLRAQAYTALYTAIQASDKAYDNWNYYHSQPSFKDVSESEAKLALASAQLEDAQREWERLKDGADPLDVDAARARVTAIQATINMAQLTAPFNGTITDVQPLMGDQVAPGTPGFRIDDLKHLLVDVQVSEVDINNIQVGQPAILSFDAILGTEYDGEVVEVSQVGTITAGVVNFDVTIELTNADRSVKPGMTAAINLIINELEDVLLVPNRAVRLVDGQRVVYVLHNGAPVKIEITLGATSDTMSEVIDGELAEGDEVILNPPLEFNTNGPPGFVQR